MNERLKETENLLHRVMKLTAMISIDRDMFPGWLDIALADMLDDLHDEYEKYVEKYNIRSSKRCNFEKEEEK
jgi:hypothetical protein